MYSLNINKIIIIIIIIKCFFAGHFLQRPHSLRQLARQNPSKSTSRPLQVLMSEDCARFTTWPSFRPVGPLGTYQNTIESHCQPLNGLDGN
jgi:hypothetical protein